jgi:hypothetical protein
MSVGFPATKGDIDSRAGGLAVALRDDLYRCSQFCGWLQSAAQTDAALIGLGYTQAEVTLLKAAFTDVGGTGISLYNVAHGGTLPGSPNDFFFNLKLLTGVV